MANLLFVDRPVILVLGLLMTIVGLTGIIRQESGALNSMERNSLMGQVLTRALGVVWLLTGAMFLFGAMTPEDTRTEIVGYTSLVATGAFLVLLTGALLAVGILHMVQRPAEAAATLVSADPRISAVPPNTPTARFKRMQIVVHPDYGRGHVLSCYEHHGEQVAAVRFIDQILAVPINTLQPYVEDPSG